MGKLAWGKCTIRIGKRGDNDQEPTDWVIAPTPVQDSTQLNPTQGDKTEAKVEGGENEDVRYNRTTYQLVFNIRGAKGRDPLFDDDEGIIPGEYALELQPEDPTVEGIRIDRGTLSVNYTYTAADGVIWQYFLDVLKPSDGSQSVKRQLITFKPATT